MERDSLYAALKTHLLLSKLGSNLVCEQKHFELTSKKMIHTCHSRKIPFDTSTYNEFLTLEKRSLFKTFFIEWV